MADRFLGTSKLIPELSLYAAALARAQCVAWARRTVSADGTLLAIVQELVVAVSHPVRIATRPAASVLAVSDARGAYVGDAMQVASSGDHLNDAARAPRSNLPLHSGRASSPTELCARIDPP